MKTKHINLLHWNNRLLCFLAIISLYGCYGLSTKNSVARVLSHRVAFPEQIIGKMDALEKPYKAMLWISGKECTRCKINALSAYLDFYECWGEYLDFFVVVSSADVSVYSRAVEDQCLPFPVYFDERNKFGFLNRYIPKKSEYHFLLLDSSNVPIVVGDPVFNTEIGRLYEDVVGVALPMS